MYSITMLQLTETLISIELAAQGAQERAARRSRWQRLETAPVWRPSSRRSARSSSGFTDPNTASASPQGQSSMRWIAPPAQADAPSHQAAAAVKQDQQAAVAGLDRLAPEDVPATSPLAAGQQRIAADPERISRQREARPSRPDRAAGVRIPPPQQAAIAPRVPAAPAPPALLEPAKARQAAASALLLAAAPLRLAEAAQDKHVPAPPQAAASRLHPDGTPPAVPNPLAARAAAAPVKDAEDANSFST